MVMYKNFCLLSYSFWIFFIFFPQTAWSQSSLIDSVLKSRQSVVHIKALREEIRALDKKKPVLNSKTGRISMAQKAITASLQKTGAGVIITTSGLIVTNFHTIQLAQKLSVRLFDGKSVGGKIVHMMPEHDLALIKIDPPYPLTPIRFANSDNVRLGDEVVNIGSSKMLKETLSGGKITGLGKMKPEKRAYGEYIELIQVNLNLYQGDSGGPLLNKHGHLIGMMAAKLKTKNRASFAIPSNKIKKLYINYVK